MSQSTDPINYQNLTDYSPIEIAHAIFSKEPADPLTNNLLIDQDSADTTYIFEILLTVLMEGLDILYGGLQELDMTNFGTHNITHLNSWFRSLGFEIKVASAERSVYSSEDSEYSYETDSEASEHNPFADYYCRVVINNAANHGLFIINNVPDTVYHFLLNGACLEANRSKEFVKDLHALFEVNDTLYKISFDFYIG